MNIKEALLKEYNIRLSNGDTWLVIDELHRLGGEFVVYYRGYGKHNTQELYRGTDEDEAVRILLDKDENEQDED